MYSSIMMGEIIEGMGQVFEKFLFVANVVSLEHGTYLHHVIRLGNPFFSRVKTISISQHTLLSPSNNALVIVTLCYGPKLSSSQMMPSHVWCLTMIKGSLSQNHYIINIIHPMLVCIYSILLHHITL